MIKKRRPETQGSRSQGVSSLFHIGISTGSRHFCFGRYLGSRLDHHKVNGSLWVIHCFKATMNPYTKILALNMNYISTWKPVTCFQFGGIHGALMHWESPHLEESNTKKALLRSVGWCDTTGTRQRASPRIRTTTETETIELLILLLSNPGLVLSEFTILSLGYPRVGTHPPCPLQKINQW